MRLTAGEEFILAIVAFVMVNVLAMVVMARRYKKVGPDQAMVVYGRNRFTVITGGAKFVLPIVESIRYMDIGAKTLDFVVERASTKSAIPLDVEISAVVKVSTERTKLNRAVQQWMSRPSAEVVAAAQTAIVSAVRSAASQWEVEAIHTEREGFVAKVRELTVTDFADLGMELVALHLREVKDSGGVLEALGRRKAADIKQKAEVAAAVAGALPLAAVALDPKAARRADVGQRLLQQLPDLTDDQVERMAAVLERERPKAQAREVDSSLEGD